MHVVDHWAYLGTARSEEDLAMLGARDSSLAFDVDVYRILVRYFAKNPKLEWLDLRPAEAADRTGRAGRRRPPVRAYHCACGRV